MSTCQESRITPEQFAEADNRSGCAGPLRQGQLGRAGQSVWSACGRTAPAFVQEASDADLRDMAPSLSRCRKRAICRPGNSFSSTPSASQRPHPIPIGSTSTNGDLRANRRHERHRGQGRAQHGT